MTWRRLSIPFLWKNYGVWAKKKAHVLRKHGLSTIVHIAASDLYFLEAWFGTLGKTIWEMTQGVDHRIVESDSKAKLMGREYTFSEDINDSPLIKAMLLYLAEDVGFRLREMGVKGKTIGIKLRYSDFNTLIRRKTLSEPVNLANKIHSHCIDLLKSLRLQKRYFRLIGMAVSGLTDLGTKQLSLFDTEQDKKAGKIALVIASLKEKFRVEIVTAARLLGLKKRLVPVNKACLVFISFLQK